ncbi:hypothetical protein HPB51_029179 [Rhipicephalus microplus]|uniref:Uncharacterized protein n=1 Tax=Rhipicephalus microplus TaxID=6941 RepID=A0A9J6CV96_RHIMP|nr:hypothetical protein HPB51_029179 [Rhipicephalus microplus]
MSSCLARAYRPTEKEQRRSDGDRGSGDRDGRERSRAVNSARPVIHALSERGEFGEPTPCLRVDGTRRDDSPPRRVRLYMGRTLYQRMEPETYSSTVFLSLLFSFSFSSVNDAHSVSTTGATTSFQLSPPIQGATPTAKEGSPGADVKVSRDDAKSLSYGDRSPPKVKAWPGMPSGSPSLSSSPGRKGVIMTPPRSPSLSILPDTRDEVNPALIQAKMVLERLQEAHMQREEERKRAMLKKKKKKKKLPAASLGGTLRRMRSI